MMKTGLVTSVTATETATGSVSVVSTFTDGTTATDTVNSGDMRVGAIRTLANIGLTADAAVERTHSYATTMANMYAVKSVIRFS
jgi:hypothetical protein